MKINRFEAAEYGQGVDHNRTFYQMIAYAKLALDYGPDCIKKP